MVVDNHLLKSTKEPWLNSFNDISFRFLQITIMIVVVAWVSRFCNKMFNALITLTVFLAMFIVENLLSDIHSLPYVYVRATWLPCMNVLNLSWQLNIWIMSHIAHIFLPFMGQWLEWKKKLYQFFWLIILQQIQVIYSHNLHAIRVPGFISRQPIKRQNTGCVLHFALPLAFQRWDLNIWMTVFHVYSLPYSLCGIKILPCSTSPTVSRSEKNGHISPIKV